MTHIIVFPKYVNASVSYATEIKERIIRTLQAELPNDKRDRIREIVEENFNRLLQNDQ